MEDIGNLQKIFHVYEERYHKAEKMGIDESSPFYAAMKEIECRLNCSNLCGQYKKRSYEDNI